MTQQKPNGSQQGPSEKKPLSRRDAMKRIAGFAAAASIPVAGGLSCINPFSVPYCSYYTTNYYYYSEYSSGYSSYYASYSAYYGVTSYYYYSYYYDSYYTSYAGQYTSEYCSNS
ncbi:MAG TPA: hypothetical protein VKF42_01170 [Chitinivibrionales bacterium]|jgi:hypothetical protein|nr:hypothetical protein [Chitinivibrionales bacterium]